MCAYAAQSQRRSPRAGRRPRPRSPIRRRRRRGRGGAQQLVRAAPGHEVDGRAGRRERRSEPPVVTSIVAERIEVVVDRRYSVLADRDPVEVVAALFRRGALADAGGLPRAVPLPTFMVSISTPGTCRRIPQGSRVVGMSSSSCRLNVAPVWIWRSSRPGGVAGQR